VSGVVVLGGIRGNAVIGAVVAVVVGLAGVIGAVRQLVVYSRHNRTVRPVPHSVDRRAPLGRLTMSAIVTARRSSLAQSFFGAVIGGPSPGA
jgi:hypothetical protein